MSIKKLEQEIEQLKQRMKELEDKFNTPFYPPVPTDTTVVSRCPKCGIELNRVMGYVCNAFDCPVFPKVRC